jgi:hypothetical protein
MTIGMENKLQNKNKYMTIGMQNKLQNKSKHDNKHGKQITKQK